MKKVIFPTTITRNAIMVLTILLKRDVFGVGRSLRIWVEGSYSVKNKMAGSV